MIIILLLLSSAPEGSVSAVSTTGGMRRWEENSLTETPPPIDRDEGSDMSFPTHSRPTDKEKECEWWVVSGERKLRNYII